MSLSKAKVEWKETMKNGYIGIRKQYETAKQKKKKSDQYNVVTLVPINDTRAFCPIHSDHCLTFGECYSWCSD